MYKNQFNALAETALAIHQQWSASNLMATPFGAILVASYPITDKDNTIEFIRSSAVSPFFRLARVNENWTCSNATFVGKDIEQLVDDATQICEAISQYLASDDFLKKSDGAIARLKRITRAIKGE